MYIDLSRVLSWDSLVRTVNFRIRWEVFESCKGSQLSQQVVPYSARALALGILNHGISSQIGRDATIPVLIVC